MNTKEEYSIANAQREEVLELYSSLKQIALSARKIHVSAKDDVDYFDLEYRDPKERELYDRIVETEKILAQTAELLRERYADCAWARDRGQFV